MSPVEGPSGRDEAGGLARVLRDALLGISVPLIRELAAGVVLIGLMLLVLPLAAAVFVATSLLYYGVLMLVGVPSGTLGVVLGLTWFGGSLVLIGWLCVLAWRRVRFIRVIAGLASDSAEEEPAPTAYVSIRDPRADSDTVLKRVAAADARLADSAADPDGDDRTYQ